MSSNTSKTSMLSPFVLGWKHFVYRFSKGEEDILTYNDRGLFLPCQVIKREHLLSFFLLL